MTTRISRNQIRALVQCSMGCRGTCRKRAPWSIWKVWKNGGRQVGARTRTADCTAQGGKGGKQGVIVGHTAHLPIRRWRGALGGGGGLSSRGEDGTIAGRSRVWSCLPNQAGQFGTLSTSLHDRRLARPTASAARRRRFSRALQGTARHCRSCSRCFRRRRGRQSLMPA